jgi:carbamoyl-phosphate synthase large subunit
MSDVNVLVSSAGRRVSLVRILKQTLADMGLPGRVLAVELSRLSPAFHICDQGWVVPSCDSPGYVSALLEICAREKVRLLIPTIDPDLEVLAAHRLEFQACGTTVAIPDLETVQIGSDKRRTHQWLVEHGFPTVQQILPEDLLSRKGNGWAFPLIAKPRFGSASIGVAIVENLEEVERLARKGDYIIQTLAAGREYTVDFLATRQGRCVCAVPRLRIAVRGGEVSKGMTVRNPEIISLVHRMCEALPGAYGVLNVQLFLDSATGKIAVIEINPRFGGGFPLAWQAGARFPQWMLEELLGWNSTAVENAWEDRLLMLRYDEAVFISAAQGGI